MLDERQKNKRSGNFYWQPVARLVAGRFGDESGRVIDLRGGTITPSISEKERERKREEKTENKIKKKEGATLYFPRWSSIEPLEISSPSREEVFDMLERIEQLNAGLKGKNFSYTKETKAILSADKQGDALPVELNLTEFLSISHSENKEDAVIIGENYQSVAESSLGEQLLSDNFSLEEFILTDNTNQIKKTTAARKNWIKFFQCSAGQKKKKRSKKIMRRGAGFAGAASLIFLVIFGMSLAGQGLSAKSSILSSALQAYQAMLSAKDSASRLDFSGAGVNFETAYQNFFQANQELNKMGKALIAVLEKLPGGSVVASGSALISAGENIAQAGNSFAKIGSLFLTEKISDYFSGGGLSLTDKIAQSQKEISVANDALVAATRDLEKVDSADLPEDMAGQVEELKQKIPTLAKALNQVNDWSQIFLEGLGHWRAKKYLLIFQNNSEARPTGGFIGTYGVLDVDRGQIKNLFIDGIFNLDGQLYDKIVPPQPIQKISTAWSTHDANWFFDFALSAKKILSFYEKAGGATADGVISLTPTVIEKLLAITGPISMPAYGVTLDQNNFLDVTQYKVEVDYDKELNQPKKILADFAPLFLERLWAVWPQNSKAILEIFTDALAEKHILFYFSDLKMQQVFEQQDWAGRALDTDKDYLAVVNTNINGFKTDKVVVQTVEHQASIQSDGSVIDTVKITRVHQGGQSQYDWYNKVNANYLRVYVPAGSKLLSAQGQTLEINSEPINYEAQGFIQDQDVLSQEAGKIIDQKTGTQIFAESNKTVFGNWVYVSPGETVEITYQYKLPFKVDLTADNFSWSLLAQKQPGSRTSGFVGILQLPTEYKINWQYPADLQIFGSQIKMTGDLQVDKFYGVVFGK